MREAFVYMFKDNCFSKKAFIYFLLSFCALFFVALADITSSNISCLTTQTPCILNTIKPEIYGYQILSFLFDILIIGYFLSNLEALQKQNLNIVLPFFNLKLNFTKGLKFFAGVFITFLIYYLLITGFVILGFVFTKIELHRFLPFLVALPIIFYVICYCSFMYEFANSNKILTLLNYKTLVLRIKNNLGNYFKHASCLILIFITGAIFAFLIECCFSFLFNNAYVVMILTNIISALINTYVAYVSIYLIHKSVRA